VGGEALYSQGFAETASVLTPVQVCQEMTSVKISVQTCTKNTAERKRFQFLHRL